MRGSRKAFPVGPALSTFFVVYEGKEGLNASRVHTSISENRLYNLKPGIVGRPVKRHLNGVSLAGR